MALGGLKVGHRLALFRNRYGKAESLAEIL